MRKGFFFERNDYSGECYDKKAPGHYRLVILKLPQREHPRYWGKSIQSVRRLLIGKDFVEVDPSLMTMV